MKILVMGGTRFVGRSIVERLLREGHNVTLLNRGISPDPFGTRVRRVLGDRREPGFVERATANRDYDAVVDVNAFREQDTVSAISAFKDRLAHFVHISTAAVYLIRDALMPPFRETDSAGPVSEVKPGKEAFWDYAVHKERCEASLLAAWEEHRFPSTSLRLPVVVGEHDYTRRADAYLERLASGGPMILPEGGLNSWGFLWVDDVAEAVAANLANASAFGRVYNLAQREALSLRRFVEMAARFLGRQTELLSLPSSWLTAIGLGTSSSPFSHDNDILLDCRAAEEDLLFRPTEALRSVELLVEDFRRRWDGIHRAYASTRSFELALAREVSKIRLPSCVPTRATVG